MTPTFTMTHSADPQTSQQAPQTQNDQSTDNQSANTQSTNPQKPIAPIQSLLIKSWIGWFVCRLLAYPMAVAYFGGGSFWYGVMWQTLALLPAFVFSRTVWQGNSAYGLLWLSMVMLVYLGAVGVFALMRLYEKANAMVSGVLLVEFIIVLGINVLLFMLLKRLPPMHKQRA